MLHFRTNTKIPQLLTPSKLKTLSKKYIFFYHVANRSKEMGLLSLIPLNLIRINLIQSDFLSTVCLRTKRYSTDTINNTK